MDLLVPCLGLGLAPLARPPLLRAAAALLLALPARGCSCTIGHYCFLLVL